MHAVSLRRPLHCNAHDGRKPWIVVAPPEDEESPLEEPDLGQAVPPGAEEQPPLDVLHLQAPHRRPRERLRPGRPAQRAQQRCSQVLRAEDNSIKYEFVGLIQMYCSCRVNFCSGQDRFYLVK
jgi:hypothetical protein